MEDETFAQLTDALESVTRALNEQDRFNKLLAGEQNKLWDEVARVRDDMHLAIRGLTMAPDAVAAAILPFTKKENDD